MRLPSSVAALARRVAIALSVLHAVFGTSLALRDARFPLGIVQASVGHAPGWMLFVNLRPTNTHAWMYPSVPFSSFEVNNAVELNIWTLDLTHASFVQYLTLEFPLDRALDLLVTYHMMSSALTLLVLALLLQGGDGHSLTTIGSTVSNSLQDDIEQLVNMNRIRRGLAPGAGGVRRASR